MDYFAGFDISGSGMAVQKARLDAVALNLANVHTALGSDGGLYRPQEVISGARGDAPFPSYLEQAGLPGMGAEVVETRALDLPPRLVHDPGHPYADERGYVSYPGINPVFEMVRMIEAVQAYEANVRALNAAKTMALRALEIGRGS
jgi:flagellar basal-body rod protein FlgC